MAPESRRGNPTFGSEWVEAFNGKHGQMDIRLDGVALSIPGSPFAVVLNGAVSVSVHMRDLTADERRAHAAKNLSQIRGR